MHVSVPALVFGGWLFICGVSLVSLGYFLYQGFWGSWPLTTWREVKFAATLGGAFSLFFLMLNFETLVRSDFVGKTSPAHILTYTDAKFLVAKRYAAECGTKPTTPSQERICSDLSTVYDQISYIPVRERNAMSHIDVANRAPQLQSFFTDVNKAIDQVNLYAEKPEDRYKSLSLESRLGWTFLAGLLLPLCLAGSVGEAAYQVREAHKKAAEDVEKQKQEMERGKAEKEKASLAAPMPGQQQQQAPGGLSDVASDALNTTPPGETAAPTKPA